MTVSQMLFHCKEALGTATGNTTTNIPFLLKIIGPIFIRRMVLSSKPYKPELPTAKEFIITENKDFEVEKIAALDRINQFITNEEKTVEGLKHPLFVKMTAEEWGFSQWKHFDHHLKQFGV